MSASFPSVLLGGISLTQHNLTRFESWWSEKLSPVINPGNICFYPGFNP